MKFLHVGCGHSTKKDLVTPAFSEWEEVRLDADESCQPDIVDTMPLLKSVESNTFQGLYCSHALEHLNIYDAALAVRNFHRVLQPPGICFIIVPDFREACRAIADGKGTEIYLSPAGPIFAHDIIFGKQDWAHGNDFMQHRTGFTSELLRGIFLGAGFFITSLNTDGNNLWIVGQKGK